MTFNGTFTLTSKRTGNHITVKAETVKEDSRWEAARGKQVFKFMVGRDNENSFACVGFIENGRLNMFKKFQNQYSNRVQAAQYAAQVLAQGIEEDDSVLVEGAKCCLRCNRKLTNPESLRTGIGPECAKRG